VYFILYSLYYISPDRVADPPDTNSKGGGSVGFLITHTQKYACGQEKYFSPCQRVDGPSRLNPQLIR